MEFRRLLSKPWSMPLLIVSSGIAVFILLLATAPGSPSVPPKERSWRVETIVAEPRALAPTVTLYGQIETPSLLNAAAPGKSRVTGVHVKEGDAVTTGQILLELDPRDFEPKLTQARARADELKALIASEKLRHRNDKVAIGHEKSILKLERLAMERAEQLKQRKLGSQAALEEAEEALKRQQLSITNRQLALDDHNARLQQLGARLAYAEAEVELAELDLERSRVISPFDGYVEKLSVAAGDQVQEGQVLLTLYPRDKLELRAKIPATYQHEIQRALNTETPLQAVADYAGAKLELVLDRLSGKADSRGIDALFNIRSGGEWVRLGASLSAVLQRPLMQDVIALPYSAIYDDNRVYRVTDGRMQGVTVDILGEYRQPDMTGLLIRSERLQAGDRIITTQLPDAVSGMKVEIR